MKNTIASLQAELEAARDGVSATSNGIMALQEGANTPDTARLPVKPCVRHLREKRASGRRMPRC